MGTIALSTRARTRKAKYPHRFFGRTIEARVQELCDEGKFSGARGAARFLDYEEQRLSDWKGGHALPKTQEDVDRLTRLGLDNDALVELVVMDRLDLWRQSEEMSATKLVALAKRLLAATRGGLTPVPGTTSGAKRKQKADEMGSR